MNCPETQTSIPDFLSGALSSAQVQKLWEHISLCALCKKELGAYQETWSLLGAWEEAEPDAGYVDRFWPRLEASTTWREKFAQAVKSFFMPQRLAVGSVLLAAICVLGFVSISQMRIRETERVLTSLSREDFEMLGNLGLAGAMDVLEDWEILMDMDLLLQIPEGGVERSP